MSLLRPMTAMTGRSRAILEEVIHRILSLLHLSIDFSVIYIYKTRSQQSQIFKVAYFCQGQKCSTSYLGTPHFRSVVLVPPTQGVYKVVENCTYGTSGTRSTFKNFFGWRYQSTDIYCFGIKSFLIFLAVSLSKISTNLYHYCPLLRSNAEIQACFG